MKHRFTFMELVFVVAAGAILAGLLTPLFAGARQQAKLASCTGNLRKCGVVRAMYSLDNNGRFMMTYTAQKRPLVSWIWNFSVNRLKYLPVTDGDGCPWRGNRFSCKTARCPQTVLDKSNGSAFLNNNHYGALFNILGSFGKNVDNELGRYVLRTGAKNASGDFYMDEKLAKYPEDSPVFTDVWGTEGGRQTFYIGDQDLVDRHIWTRHENRANLCFVDGHVAAMTADELKDSPMQVKYTYNGAKKKVTK